MINMTKEAARVAAAKRLADEARTEAAAKRAARAAVLSPEKKLAAEAEAAARSAAAAEQWEANTEAPQAEVILSPEESEARRVAHRARVDAANAEREFMLAARAEASGGDLLRWMGEQAPDSRWAIRDEESGNAAYLTLGGAIVAHMRTADVPHGTMGRHTKLEAVVAVRSLLERHTTIVRWVGSL